MSKLEKCILGTAIFLLIVDFFFIILLNISPIIILKDGDLKIGVNETYQEPGYYAFYKLSNVTKKIKVKNNIQITKTGTYEVIYEIKYHGKTYQKIRNVIVEDRIAPEIILNGNQSVILCPNGEYQEEGYSGIDNYDGDITDKIQIKKEKNFILYSLKDKAGNESVLKREFRYEDIIAPSITLNDKDTLSLYIGDTYQEPGYHAIDNCDGNITNKVKVTGTVDTSKKGHYEISYEVTDQSGKSSIVVRTVNVSGQKPDNKKVIYLTFDDGPSANITPALLDILKEENVKATFFVLNKSSELDYLIAREYKEGHTVALHGSSHNYQKIYSSSSDFWADMYLIQNKVMNITGERSMIIRFPGGSSNTVSRFNPGIMTNLSKEAKEKGFHYFDWNVDSGDAGNAKTADDVYYNVINSLGAKNNIVLMHDYGSNYKTLEAIKRIIEYGKTNGYTFKAITYTTPEVHHRIAN